jgi:hypothetical protein
MSPPQKSEIWKWQNETGAQKEHRRRNTNYEIKAFVEN